MEELIIQKHWDHAALNVESNHIIGVRTENNKKDRIITTVIIILLLSFALLFTGYCFRKVRSYLYPQYNLEWQCQVPQIPSSMPVYEVMPISSQESLEQNLQLAEMIGAEYTRIFCTEKHGIFIDADSENGVHLLIQNNENRGYRYLTRKHFWTGWKSADRTELEKQLQLYSISIPDNAQFRVDGNGWHTFAIDPYLRDGAMIAGEIRCRYASDGSVVALENELLEYVIAEYCPVINAQTVQNELLSGKYFRNMGIDGGANLRILSSGITYKQTNDHSCVPYCCFQIQQGSSTELKEIMIPLLTE